MRYNKLINQKNYIDNGDHYDENGTITYKRIDDKFRIIKKVK